jgi:uncharacterized protein involved in type VI secretion and phage assembly
MNSNIHGLIYGVITDNADPDQLGRVKVKLDHLGENIITGWIPMVTPIIGVFALPEIKEQVLVAFIGGNPDNCVVTGSSWNTVQKPPLSGENAGSDLNKDGENNLRFIKSRSGHRIIFDDKKGEEKLQILTGDGSTRFEFLAKASCLKLTTKKDLKISAKGKVLIEGEEGSIKMKKGIINQGENIKIDGKSKDISIKGKNIIIEGSGINLN